jgi:hypothetical protein
MLSGIKNPAVIFCWMRGAHVMATEVSPPSDRYSALATGLNQMSMPCIGFFNTEREGG